MLGQTFAASDLPKVALLSFLEIFLSADNAIILGLLTARLKAESRGIALAIGLFSAFILRALALFWIAALIQYPWIQYLGSAYLIYLSLRYFTSGKRKNKELQAPIVKLR